MAAMRSALLKHLRVKTGYPLQSPVRFSFSELLCRHFSEDVKGSFLDKSEVTDRVITVVKNFQKVDPSKVKIMQRLNHGVAVVYDVKCCPHVVTPKANFQSDLGLDSLDTVEVVMALEEEFGFEIPDNEADKISSIDVAVDFIASHPQAK